jgi:hypothetical protein
MTESWKRIPKRGGYEASTLGRIRSTQFGQPRILTSHGGRVMIYLENEAGELKRYCVTVASLVLLAFRGKPRKGQLAYRFRGEDDRLSNIKYMTRTEAGALHKVKKPCSRSSTRRRVSPK